MASEKIKLSSISIKNGWYTLTTYDGKQISVMENKNPKLKAILDLAKEGDTVEGNVVEKDGKFYMWDPKEAKKFPAKDKSFEAAVAAATATATMLSNNGDIKSFPSVFESIHALIMSKATQNNQ